MLEWSFEHLHHVVLTNNVNSLSAMSISVTGTSSRIALLAESNRFTLLNWSHNFQFSTIDSQLQINFWVPSLTGFLCLYFQFLGFVCTFLQSHNYCQITALYLQSTSLVTVPSLGYSQLNHFWQWIVFLLGESSISRAYTHILTTIHTQTTVKVITCLTVTWKISKQTWVVTLFWQNLWHFC